MLNVAVIGARGRQGRRRIESLKGMRDAAVTWMVGRSGAADLERIAQASGGGRVSTSWQEAVSDPATDVVIVCTPNTTHAEIAIAALQHGKHVLVEKPLASTLEDVARIVKTANACGTVLRTGFNYPFRPPVAKAIDYLRSGVIGDPTVVRAHIGHSRFMNADPHSSWFRDSKQVGRGVLLDLGIHVIDLARSIIDFAGDQFDSVIATTRARTGWNSHLTIEDDAIAVYRTRSGRLVVVHASWQEVRSDLGFSWTILGTEGRIDVDLSTRTTKLFRNLTDTVHEEQTQFDFVSPDPSFEREWEMFRDAIEQRVCLECDIKEQLDTHHLIFCAYESAATGGVPVKIGNLGPLIS